MIADESLLFKETDLMRFSLRTIPADTTFPDALTIDLFTHMLPPTLVTQAIAMASRRQQRVRKLSHAAIIWLVVAMNLWSHLSIEHVFQKLTRGLRFIWPDPTFPFPTRSALCYRRYQLGARPFVALFHQRCVPLATPATPGAFLFGYRLMAIDSTTEIVPDTPSNDAAFGRMRGSRGASAFPQVRAVYLVECGTHAVVDAGFWPCNTHERVGGHRMLRKLQPDMLLMWDRGFHSYSMFDTVQARGAHVLARLSLSVHPQICETMADGSALIKITPVNHGRPVWNGGLQLRMISYRLTDPALGDITTIHRVVTSLLDPIRYPAADLVCAYHERWEIELAIDELDTHQRVARQPLRSQQPAGVIQELYGLLLTHYLVRAVMHEAAAARSIDPDRISFVHAIRLIQDAIPESQMVAAAQVSQLYDRLLTDLCARLLPIRRLRMYPRLLKQTVTKFLRKRPEDPPLRQPTMAFRAAVAMTSEPLSPTRTRRPRGRPRKES
jgi:hypothetical protein